MTTLTDLVSGADIAPSLSKPKTSVFANLAALKVDPGVAGLGGANEHTSSMSVRRATGTEFIRIHPGEDKTITLVLHEDKENLRSEYYVVLPHMVQELTELGGAIYAQIYTATNRQGAKFLYPVKLPTGGASNPWQETSMDAVTAAKANWVRIFADTGRGCYRIMQAEGDLEEPEFLDKPLNELLEMGFKDRIIDNSDHPICRKLRGRNLVMKTSNANSDGGLRATIDFKHVICVDLEFQIKNGDRPWPVCMVVTEAITGVTQRYWRDDLLRLDRAPFEIGSDAVVVAYAAQAELSCFLGLGWKLPVNVLDVYAEFRVRTNGYQRHASILNALATFGLAHIDAGEKDAMRKLVLRGGWSSEEQEAILKYCESDVAALVALLDAMSSTIDWPRALLRGRYAAAVATIEHTGVPIDAKLLRTVSRKWHGVKKRLTAEVDQSYGVFHGSTFKIDQFSRWLRLNDISWPRLASGRLDLSDDAFKLQEQVWPILAPLRALRQTLGQVRLDDLRVGLDGRTRSSLRPFASITGRNQPSTTAFAFGPAKWTRGFIRPNEGYGIAYIDFSSQEIGIAAGLSQDERLIAAYDGDDPYIAFAKEAKRVPVDATKETHPEIRNQCKAVVLGQNYGMGAQSIALQAGITAIEARELIALHKRTYRTFWKWSEETVSSALLSGTMQTVFGWKRQVTSQDKVTSLMNFPMQANGAEMMRIAAIAATEAGISVCAPIHDAFLITAPLARLDDDVAEMQAIMTQAGKLVVGLPIKTEVKIFRYPNRYMEDRGIEMWNRVVRLVDLPREQI